MGFRPDKRGYPPIPPTETIMKDSMLGGLVSGGSEALIGREAEMAALLDAYEAVTKRRETRVISIIGPAGIGKSRLIQDFITKVRPQVAPSSVSAQASSSPAP